MDNRGAVRLTEAARLCALPIDTLKGWLEEDGVPFSKGRGVDRRDLRHALKLRGVETPSDLEPWPYVLIADDDEELRRVMDWLVRCAWADSEVLSVPDTGLARQMLPELRPDLLVTDLRMDGAGGESLLQFVRSDPGLRDTKVLVVTGYDDPETRMRLLGEGADGYMAKPFEPRQLREMIVRLMGHGPAPRVQEAVP